MNFLKSTFFLFLFFSVFLIQGCKKLEPPTLAAVTIVSVTEITDASAKVEIDITSDGRGTITEAGVRLNGSGQNFTTTTSVLKGKSTLLLNGLKKASSYTIVAYVVNEVGTYNSQEMTFTTSARVPTLTLDTENITPITATTAILPNYRIADDGGATAFYRGACWSTNPNPTIADFTSKDTIINKAYIGLFSSLINLKPKTKYYLRPYAINSVGVGYGKELSFTTDENFSCQPNPIEPEIIVSNILSLPGDKFMLTGLFQKVNGISHYNAAVFNNDGSFDNSFASTASDYQFLNSTSNRPTYLSNGKVIIPAINMTNGRYTVLRLNSNGSLDQNFKIPLGANNQILKTIVLADGKIILVGRFTDFSGVSANRVVKLNPDGTIDGSFVLGSITWGSISNAVTLNNGTVLIQTAATNGFQNYVLKADGSFDTGSKWHNAFNRNQIIAVLKNNQLIGSDQTSVLSRLNADGTIDNTYKNYKFAASPTSNSSYILYELNDGKFLLGINSTVNTTQVFTISKLNNDGSPDISFGLNGSGSLEYRDGSITSIITASDGKILIGGNFRLFMDRIARNFIKINANGSFCN